MAHDHLTGRKTLSVLGGLSALLVASVLIGLRVGAYDISLPHIFHLLFQRTPSPAEASAYAVLHDIRLPRVLLALLVGGGLSVAGAVFQVLLRNVLADPYILGISGGASVGALVAIATGLSTVALFVQPLFAFVGAVLVVLIVYVVGSRGRVHDNTLLLTGVMIGAFLSAIILALVSTLDRPLRNALFWLIGYLGNATIDEVLLLLPVVFILVVAAMFHAGRLNVLALGATAAQHLGISVRSTTLQLYIIASLLTAAVVSFSGAIGFVGLIIPHMCRRLFGPDHRLHIPASFLSGAVFLIISDIIARSVISPSELPVGAVTAALGAPVFIYLLRRKS
ncbi:iron ABC transporter permease [bacterium]|nr:iron ABC transporter permease [bacterium]